ncbi:DUF5606 domain-containing protein [Bacteroides sp. OF04-15BH]|jgi:hypothetical protein|uniref:DUF5606 family protein n=1 Tax=Bacteroides sp. OF04-15BH TaxID=2292281 RepID=UPI000E48D3A3|nr:DUF5606 domain-containing protein [Bacteroides sp. OF04-15BH]RHP65828.1 hypothetical protein DXA74_04780 [Bacteroides sp. OF04-15BH]
MLQTVLAIAGKPGLYRLVSRGNKNLIVESLDAAKKRTPIFGADKVISLADIAMYTDNGEVPLAEVLQKVADKESAKEASLNPKKASNEELQNYFAEILPDYDRERVYMTDIKKLLTWYNLLVNAGITVFVEKEQE